MKTKDYLGKARLVAASDRSNAFTGFAGSEMKNVSARFSTLYSICLLSPNSLKQRQKTTDQPKIYLSLRQIWSSPAFSPEDSSPSPQTAAATLSPQLLLLKTIDQAGVLLYGALDRDRMSASSAFRHKRAAGGMRRQRPHKNDRNHIRDQHPPILRGVSPRENPHEGKEPSRKSPHTAMRDTICTRAGEEANNLGPDNSDTMMRTMVRTMIMDLLTKANSKWYRAYDAVLGLFPDLPARRRDDLIFGRSVSRFTRMM